MTNITKEELVEQLKKTASNVQNPTDWESLKIIGKHVNSISSLDLDVLTNMDITDILLVLILSLTNITDDELPDIKSKLDILKSKLIEARGNEEATIRLLRCAKQISIHEKARKSIDPLISDLKDKKYPTFFTVYAPLFNRLQKAFGSDEKAIITFLELSHRTGSKPFELLANLSGVLQKYEKINPSRNYMAVNINTGIISEVGRKVKRINRKKIKDKTNEAKQIYIRKTREKLSALGLTALGESYNNRLAASQSEKKQNITTSKVITEMIRVLESCGKGELPEIDIKNIDNAVIDPTLFNEFITYLANYAEETYEKLKLETDKGPIALDRFETECQENDFDQNSFSAEEKTLLSKYSKTSLLPFLNKNPYLFTKDSYHLLFEILMVTDARIIDVLSTYLDEGIIDESFIKNNLGIFSRSLSILKENGIESQFIEKPLFDILAQNIIAILKSEHGNSMPNIKNSNPEVLISNPETLISNLETLKEYGLVYKVSDTNYSLLQDPSLIVTVDAFIEMGVFDAVKNNLSLIDEKASNLVKRVRICDSLDIAYLDADGTIMPFLLGKTFQPVNGITIVDADLDNYIYSDVDKYIAPEYKTILDNQDREDIAETDIKPQKLIDQLRTFSIDKKEIYSFDGVIISANKAHRNIARLMTATKEESESDIGNIIFSSIIHGSVLTETQIEKINNCLNSMDITPRGNPVLKK